MKPRLVAVTGPLAGGTFPLGAGPLLLGRQPESGLQLRDLAVSRRHCILTFDAGGCLLRDLDSRRGTFVNGIPVRERVLEPGDLINVGGSLFLYRADAETPQVSSGLLDASDLVAASTLHWPLGTSPPPEGQADRDLAALLQVAEDLHALPTAEALARRLLALVFAISPAERACVLFLNGEGEPETACAQGRHGPVEPFAVSGPLLARVIADGQALLATGVAPAAGGTGTPGLLSTPPGSLLAIPLPVSGETAGLLYAETRVSAAPLAEGHLAVLTAACRMAALALGTVRRAAWHEAERSRLEAALRQDLVGESPRLQEVYRLLLRAAATPSTVLLGGESGTGKELAARTLHDRSPRAGRPFVAINCATLSETLLESELFGHEKGAFTGAVERKTGKLELAHTGTVFLDEVGEIPLGLQAKLLRFLQERDFERVGGTRPIRVDVRVVAATHRDLDQAIRGGTFRADLFYRLAVIRLTLPPLRERREDIPLLASHFAARFSRELGRPVAGFSPAARACLERYTWPGNIRELKNAIERAVALGDGELIVPADLPETVLEVAGAKDEPLGLPPFHAALNDLKKRLIVEAVRAAHGNVSAAARALGLHPNYLHRLITHLELRAAL
ncbi:MAG TPA: sigma-54-dependent Fis family transcriptional regulator [Acidobacteria bacterium]|nr:sigma-54-dependent Fis family transcriptional regulator [Acidobacteriota bacterium]